MMELVLGIIAGIVVAKIVSWSKGANKKEQFDGMGQDAQRQSQTRGSAINRDFGNPFLAGAVGGAATMFLLNHLHANHNFDQQTLEEMQQMDYEQLQNFALENNLLEEQEMSELMAQFDPYVNPGTDIITDHYYHGHDQGIDDAYYGHDHNTFDNFTDFGGMNDF